MQKRTHSQKVSAIQAQVREFYQNHQRAKMYHGSSNSTRPFRANGLKYIDVSDFKEVVEVNAAQQYALVEPNVPLDALVRATLKYGLIPPMVAEFPGITVGGAVQGGSGESSSFKWGTFDETCLEYEVVLGNGQIVTASATQRDDLYYGLPCSFGSLGVLTLLKIKLIPATKYVKVTYLPTVSFNDTVSAIRQSCKEPVDFVDGILFAKNRGVVITGSYTNEQRLPVARFSRWYNDWFYLHAAKVSRKQTQYEEIIPLADYLFRYDRGGFWVAKYGFRRTPFNRLTRLLLSSLFSTRRLFKLLHGSNYAYVYMAQDVCLPEKSVSRFLQFAHDEFGIYPLWLCPLKAAAKAKLSPTALQTDLVINVGIWGEMKPSTDDFTARNRSLEQRVRKLGGRKVLYAHAYYTEDEFWNIYDKSSYQKLRQKYAAEVVLPSVYEKTKTQPAPAKPSKRQGLKALLNTPYHR